MLMLMGGGGGLIISRVGEKAQLSRESKLI